MRRGADGAKLRRDKWPWWSLLPGGLGAWAPILAGVRRRVWWWVALGLFWTGMFVAALVLAAIDAHHSVPGRKSAIGALELGAWFGGAITSFAIRRSYDRRTTAEGPGRPRVRTPWPRPTERSRRWTIRYALAAYVLTFAAANALGLLLRYPLNIHFQVGVGVILVDVWLLAALIPLRRRRGLARQDLGLRATKGPQSIGLVILALVAYGGVIALWGVTLAPHQTYQKLSAAPSPSTLNAVLAVIALSASAPIVEEIFFRGLLYRSLRNRLPIIPAALIAGCLFGLVHITSYPLVTLPVKAAFGVIACLLYERTGSLLPGIALHAFVDGSAVDIALSGNDFAVLASTGGVIVLILLTATAKRWRRPQSGEGEPVTRLADTLAR